MKENSIEEALEKLSTGKKIKMYELLRTFKREGIENFVITRKKYVDVILSDYKRVLKENEELLEVKVSASAHNRILELEKENEELKNNGVIDENEFEFAVDCDWDRLKRLIDTADKSNVKNQTIEALEELFGEEE